MEQDDDFTRITLRIPKPLHQLLTKAAKETSKSMNAEIIARLEESFAEGSQLADLTAAINRLEQQVFRQSALKIQDQANNVMLSGMIMHIANSLEGPFREANHPFAKVLADYREKATSLFLATKDQVPASKQEFDDALKNLKTTDEDLEDGDDQKP